MRLAAVALIALLAGCGGDGKRAAGPPIAASLDLATATAGAPDAGTSAGHGNDVANATTAADVFSFTGRVAPADSRVRVSDGEVRVEPSGRFTVATTAPSSGTKRLRVDASKAGRQPWSIEVRLTRAAPRDVRVPEQDGEAPSAAVALEQLGRTVVRPSPSRAGETPEVVRLAEPGFDATAAVHDSEGGTGRIRLTVMRTETCDGTAREATQSFPSAQIVNIAIPPGARVPAERQLSKRIDLELRDGCSVSGEILAEGTDAHGRQAVTAHIGFAYP